MRHQIPVAMPGPGLRQRRSHRMRADPRTPGASARTRDVGRSLRDLVDIVATPEERGVGVKSLTNGIVDTTTAHGKLAFDMFALMAEYEATLIKERTFAGLAAARTGGRKPKMYRNIRTDTVV
ncbi:recombinase family protein [Micromonospora sp. NPDC051925]|uniref:recombinase family protein n=1 Tax=Micromonospora sp. NPDC051925 TaxID=3364288 RepID=UPI0037CA37B7